MMTEVCFNRGELLLRKHEDETVILAGALQLWVSIMSSPSWVRRARDTFVDVNYGAPAFPLFPDYIPYPSSGVAL